jgi:hypothetical protein
MEQLATRVKRMMSQAGTVFPEDAIPPDALPSAPANEVVRKWRAVSVVAARRKRGGWFLGYQECR